MTAEANDSAWYSIVLKKNLQTLDDVEGRTSSMGCTPTSRKEYRPAPDGRELHLCARGCILS